MNEDNLIELNVNQIKFKKTKNMNNYHGKSYILFSNNLSKTEIKLKKVYLPFGIEIFNKKAILNVEIYPKKSNEENNMYAMLYSFENELKDKTKFPNDIKNEINELTYYNFMKSNNNNGYLIRTHMSPNPEIYAMIGKFKNALTSKDIKDVKCNIDLELGTFWINDVNYGITWFVKRIEVIM